MAQRTTKADLAAHLARVDRELHDYRRYALDLARGVRAAAEAVVQPSELGLSFDDYPTLVGRLYRLSAPDGGFIAVTAVARDGSVRDLGLHGWEAWAHDARENAGLGSDLGLLHAMLAERLRLALARAQDVSLWPHGLRVVIVEKAGPDSDGIFTIRSPDGESGEVSMTGMELEHLCRWWAAEKERAGVPGRVLQ